MTFQELVEAIAKILPNAEVGEDSDGQIVVYTSLSEAPNKEELVEFQEEGS